MNKSFASLLILLIVCGCMQKKSAPAPAPPAVSVIRTAAMPVVIYEDYAAQTEAVDAVEIRARVGGILERQAFRDGAHVKRGDLLFVIDQQPFITAQQQSHANLGQAEASWRNSQRNLARLRPLLTDAAVSQQDVDAATAKERTDAAAVAAAQAQLRQARINLGYTTIRAPRDGVMSRALIKTGGLVNASTTLLATLYSIDPMYVNFTINEEKLAGLQKQFDLHGRNTLPFRIKLADGSDYLHAGKLDFIDTAVDPRNGTLQMRLSLPNPEGRLRSGQFVHVAVPAREARNAILVPQKAVQELQGKQSVFVVGPDNKAVYRGITAKVRNGNDWIVEQGLQPGELVVVEGTGKIRPGSVVKPVSPSR